MLWSQHSWIPYGGSHANSRSIVVASAAGGWIEGDLIQGEPTTHDAHSNGVSARFKAGLFGL